jgi:hypothetical protein
MAVLSGVGAVALAEGTSAAPALLPCVAYQCDADLVASSVSSNSFELIGISSENIIGKRAFWEERVSAEDRERWLARLNRLAWTEVGSVTHAIATDRGALISVAHSFRKVRTGAEFALHGCMIPLGGEAHAATPTSVAGTAQFIHKIGNHFQLINLIVGSLARSGVSSDEVETLQLTIDRAVEFTRAFSYYSQTPVFTPGVDVGQTFQTAIDSIAPFCAENKVELKGDLGECLSGALLSGDAYLLELAFGALLQNALEATASGDRIVVGARITRSLSKGGPMALLSIVDNGCGMERKMLAKAAEPFFTSKPDHNGLGLSTACRIIEIHGGQINLSSSPGKGTRIEITLPITSAGDPSVR